MSAGRNINSQSQHWGTPPKYVTAIKKFFGGEVDFDPCSNEYSIVQAQVECRLPKDGLLIKWMYPRIYVNPPYGNDKERKTTIKHWLAKCADAHAEFGSEVLALVPVATNTGHWKRSVFGKARAVCFLYDTRLRFLENGEDKGKGAPMSCAMVYWGENYSHFFDIFIEYGAVIDIINLHEVKISKDRNALKLFE
jgi:DNA N-6-adenine-methyltransferase (Dam)